MESEMKTVLFHCPKGGVGSTTLAAHLALHAARNGLPTVAVSVDASGHLMRLLNGDDTELVQDSLIEVAPNLRAIYAPAELPDLGCFDCGKRLALLVIDMKYCGEVTLPFSVDLRIVPIIDACALRNIASEVARPGLQAQVTALVLNQYDLLSSRQTAAQQVASVRPNTVLHPVQIPNAQSIREAGERYQCVWDSAFRDSWSSRQLRAWAAQTLQQLALEPVQVGLADATPRSAPPC